MAPEREVLARAVVAALERQDEQRERREQHEVRGGRCEDRIDLRALKDSPQLGRIRQLAAQASLQTDWQCDEVAHKGDVVPRAGELACLPREVV